MAKRAPVLDPTPATAAAASPDAVSAISATMRDYLVHIYRLAEHAPDTPRTADPETRTYVSTSALAEVLAVSPPAVNRMVSRLREFHLIEHEPYQGIRLTAAGEREALRQLRLHRIAEAFLVNVMGFKWHEVHEEADRISRELGAMLAERMFQMAGCPTHCPHGEPIPTADGDIAPIHDLLLTDAPHHQPLRVMRVRTRERDRLEYLAALGLVPDAAVEVLHAAPFNGPLQLRLGDGKEYRIVGHNLAEMIRVHDSTA